MPQVISIQSAVAYGFVGNSVASFALRRARIEVWPILTVNFSNHTGYPTTRGLVIPAAEVREIIRGVDERCAFATTDAILTGYQGSLEMGEVLADAVDLARSRNPKAIYCCDPVMGDVEGFYTAEGIPEQVRDLLVPRASILTPNLFELEFLAGTRITTMDQVLAAMAEVRARGPEIVLTTSVNLPGAADDTISMVAQDSKGSWLVQTPMIPQVFTGSGDLTSAAFCAAHLEGLGLADALAKTAGVSYSILKATHDLGLAELAMVQAQDDLVSPTHVFQVRPL